MRYRTTILLGALLLFQVQPQIARVILPWFGGGPAVWSACMLFFQVQLLGGYAYAHLLNRRLAPRAQAAVHVTLLAASLLFLPVMPGEHWRPTGAENPTLHILLLLFATVGLPYLLLAATSPLLQLWFAREFPGRSPYRLYALSNVGSMAALLSFPFVFEPNLTIGEQANTWTAAYIVFFVLCGTCAWSAAQSRRCVVVDPTPAKVRPPRRGQFCRWCALAALPSVMLLAVTNAICIDIAVIPFFWVMPLALYLATFVLTFDSERWYRPVVMGSGLAGCAIVLLFFAEASWFAESVAVQAAAYCTALFLCGMVCHGALAQQKPAAQNLTAFYLAVSLGGAIGGAFVAVVAPALFDSYLEVEIGLGACVVVGMFACAGGMAHAEDMLDLLKRRVLPFAVGIAAATLVVTRASGASGYLERSRSFFGRITVHQVLVKTPNASGQVDLSSRRILRHGSTLHGEQIKGEAVEPGMGHTYFGNGSGVAYALRNHPAAKHRPLCVGVIGLGTGTLAYYANRHDRYTFYELDPAIVRVAQTHFSYVGDARLRGASARLQVGDARIQMARELQDGKPHRFDVLVVDAFSSDAIPVHLLTREANHIYWRHLAPDGILLVHVSNRFLDLLPVVRGLAEDAGKQLRLVIIGSEDSNSATGSAWALVTDNEEFLAQQKMCEVPVGTASPPSPSLLWTDDFSSLWHVVR